MVQLNRVRVGLTGFAGGPGISTFYFRDLNTARDSLQTLYVNLATLMPDDVTISIPASGDLIESTTGALVGSWAKPALASIIGTQPGVYAAPAGFILRWETGVIVAGSRVRGRTFIVPAAQVNYASNGSLDEATRTSIQGLLANFITAQSTSFVIWSRPFPGSAATPTRTARPARAGSDHLVTGGSVPDKVAVLRSRRD